MLILRIDEILVATSVILVLHSQDTVKPTLITRSSAEFQIPLAVIAKFDSLCLRVKVEFVYPYF